VPLSRLAHQSVNASGGSLPVWSSAAYGVVGLVVAWRKPGNPLGWIFLLLGLFSAAGLVLGVLLHGAVWIAGDR
jgi:hypothetical protein